MPEHAPIGDAAIAPVLEPLGRSSTFPAPAYRSDEVFRWEQEHLIGGSWFCVGRGVERQP